MEKEFEINIQIDKHKIVEGKCKFCKSWSVANEEKLTFVIDHNTNTEYAQVHCSNCSNPNGVIYHR